ncbi:hypothetical protein [uncultured Bilophila sp.]|uniref:hypothetical protein n=1 Tax=uncultured Bilophila sp. TaxID=529385 RepID=UPI00266EF1D2|nr:hypothetical protein [uncultured Bilophila sp.]
MAKMWKDGFRGKAVFDMERWKWWAISCKRLLWPRARLLLKALSYTCLFYLDNMLKKYAFSPVFRWRVPWLGDFIDYFFGISRDKVSTVFYGAAFLKRRVTWKVRIQNA